MTSQGLSNHWQLDNLFNSLFRLWTQKPSTWSSTLLALCEGNQVVASGHFCQIKHINKCQIILKFLMHLSRILVVMLAKFQHNLINFITNLGLNPGSDYLWHIAESPSVGHTAHQLPTSWWSYIQMAELLWSLDWMIPVGGWNAWRT